MKDCSLQTLSSIPCFVLLGKFGDLIQMLPVFQACKAKHGVSPIVMVEEKYAGVFEGVTYVNPWVVPFKWPNDMKAAQDEAKKHFTTVIVPQFWNLDLGVKTPKVDLSKMPNCMAAMWVQSGFTLDQMKSSMPEFDRRDKTREHALMKTVATWKRPVLLYNLEGASCPFPHAPEVMKLIREYGHGCDLVDLSVVRAERIYDLLGMFDHAVGLITTDTATLHLAAASEIHYIALTNTGWSRATPKGHCLLEVRYEKAVESERVISRMIGHLANTPRRSSAIVRNLEDPPSIERQTHWPVRIMSELPKDAEYFNCGLVDKTDGRWLVARRSKHQNTLMSFKIEAGRAVGSGVPIKMLSRIADEHFEDPRIFYHDRRMWLSCCNFLWGKVYTGAHQILCEINEDWSVRARHDVVYGGNGNHVAANQRWEKNWLWFFHEGKSYMIYTTMPHHVVEFDAKFNAKFQHSTISKAVNWKFGEPRGGTPPVRIGAEYFTFFHSSDPWPEMVSRRYHMGAYAFEARPPFRWTRYTQMPILSGSRHDRFAHPKPLVVFPCGAILNYEKWMISLGVNDLDCALMEMPHSELLKLMTSV